MTTDHRTAIADALKGRFGSTPPILGLAAAKAHAAAFAAAYPDDACLKDFDFGPTACFVRLEAARAWFYEMTPDTRDAVLRTEAVMGWFVADDEDDDTQDADGDFMSTPGCSGYDALEDIWDDLEHCSRHGLLSIDIPGINHPRS
jgi:hypothetical protein